jgi:thiosulfate dehydrogenase [quinone] large subunit
MMNRTPSPWLAVLRIYTGLFWLNHGWGKVTDANWAASGGPMATMVSKMAQGGNGAYHDFLTGTVLPNSAVFAHLVAWGETLTGVSLLVGLLTPLGAGGGVFLALNYLVAKGVDLDAAFGMDALAAVLSFANLVLPTGAILSVDSLLRRRGARPPRPTRGATSP